MAASQAGRRLLSTEAPHRPNEGVCRPPTGFVLGRSEAPELIHYEDFGMAYRTRHQPTLRETGEKPKLELQVLEDNPNFTI